MTETQSIRDQHNSTTYPLHPIKFGLLQIFSSPHFNKMLINSAIVGLHFFPFLSVFRNPQSGFLNEQDILSSETNIKYLSGKFSF